jgi:hypothetical protein
MAMGRRKLLREQQTIFERQQMEALSTLVEAQRVIDRARVQVSKLMVLDRPIEPNDQEEQQDE